jgi:leucyl aminopeptidase
VQDRNALLAGQNGLKNERLQLALEIRQAEEARQAAARKEEEDRQQRESDERWAENNRRREAEQRQAEAEDRSAPSGNNSVMQGFAQNAALMRSMTEQINSAYAGSNKSQAAKISRTTPDQAAPHDSSQSRSATTLSAVTESTQNSPARVSTRKRQPQQPYSDPDPYEASRTSAKEADRWSSLGDGKGAEREAACSLAQAKAQAYSARISTTYRTDTVSPCVCRVNFLQSKRDLDSMAESGIPDYWDCLVYGKYTKVGDAGNRSR